MNAGWIDLQVNGYAGVDFNAPGLTVEAVKEVTDRLASDGTAGFMPTLVTGDPEMLISTVRTVMAARRKYAVCEKAILGFFLEGPFISDQPGAVGTHPVEWVHAPDLALFNRFQDAAEGLVRMVNVAAEVPGMPAFVKAIADTGVTVALGHQLAKSPADIEDCIAAGAKAFTHLGNGIPNEVNRHDNIVYTALVEDRASVMFIPDGFHLPKTVLKTYVRAVPLARLVAVSDCSYPGGLPPGTYERNGSISVLEPSGFLRCGGTQLLHGSSCLLAEAVRTLQSPEVGLSPAECATVARDNPLRLVGLEGWED